jgi:hypothetical protein
MALPKPSREKVGRLRHLADRAGIELEPARMSNCWHLRDVGGTLITHPTRGDVTHTADAAIWILTQMVFRKEATVADDPKKVSKGDRIRASQQTHEVRYIAEKFGISVQAASGAIRAAGPMRKKVYAYIEEKRKAGDY